MTDGGSGLAILQTTVKQGHQPHGEMGEGDSPIRQEGKKTRDFQKSQRSSCENLDFLTLIS